MSQTPTPAELLQSRRIKALIRDRGQTIDPTCFYGNQGPVGPQGPPGIGFTLSTLTTDTGVLYYSASNTVASQLFTFTSSINPLGIVNIKGVLQVESGITTPFTQLNQQTSIPLVSTGVLWYNTYTQSLFVDGSDYTSSNVLLSSILYQTSSFVSSITALGSEGYISTTSLVSSIGGLATLGYISTPVVSFSLLSSIQGLGTSSYLSTASLNNALFSIDTALFPPGSLVLNSETNSILAPTSINNTIATSPSYNNAFFSCKANFSDITGTTQVGMFGYYFYNNSSMLSLHTGGPGHSIKSWNPNDTLAISVVSHSATNKTVNFYVNGTLVYTETGFNPIVSSSATIGPFIAGDSYTNIVYSGSYGYIPSVSTSVFLASYPYQASPTVNTFNLIDIINAYDIVPLENYYSTLYFNDSILTTNLSLQSTLQSTLVGLDTFIYISTTSLQAYEISSFIGLGASGYISSASLQSTVEGLGDLGYISSYTLTNSLISSIEGLGSTSYINSASLHSTLEGLGDLGYISSYTLINSLISSIEGLGSLGYISTTSLTSTVEGLGDLGYISTFNLINSLTSSIEGLGTSGYISSASLQSTVEGLGDSGYISTYTLINSLTSSIEGLGSASYISSASLQSTVEGLGDSGYISSYTLINSLTSSIEGLGSASYISSASLQSTVEGIGSAGFLSTTISLNNALFSFVIPDSSPPGALVFNSITNSLVAYGLDTTSFVTSVESYQNLFFTCKANISDTLAYTGIGILGVGLLSSSNYFFNNSSSLYIYTNGNTPLIKLWNSNDVLAISLVSQSASNQTVTFYVNGSVVYTQATTDNSLTYKAAFTYFNIGDTFTNIVFSGSYGFLTSTNTSVFLTSYPYVSSPTYSIINLTDATNSSNYISLSNLNTNVYINGVPFGLDNNNAIVSFASSDISIVFNSALNSIYAPNGISSIISYEYYENIFLSYKANISDTTATTQFGVTSSNTIPSYYFYNLSGYLYTDDGMIGSLIKPFNSNDVLAISIINSVSNVGYLSFYVNGSTVNTIHNLSTNYTYKPIFYSLNSNDTFTNIIFSGSYGTIDSNASVMPASYPFLQSPIVSSIKMIDSVNQSNILSLSNYQSTLNFNGLTFGYNNNNSLYSLVIPPNEGLSTNSAINTLYSSTNTSSIVNSLEVYDNIFFSCKANISANTQSLFGLVNNNTNTFSYYFYNSTGTLAAFHDGTTELIQKFNSNDTLRIIYTKSYPSSIVSFYRNDLFFSVNTPNNNNRYNVGFGGFSKEDTYSDIVFAGSYGTELSNTSIFSASYPFLQSPILSTIQMIDSGNQYGSSQISNSSLNLYFNNTKIDTVVTLSNSWYSTLDTLITLGFISSPVTHNDGLYTFAFQNPNQGKLVFNSAQNSLTVSRANLAPSLIVSQESYNSIYFSCTPYIQPESDKEFGIVDSLNNFRFYFIPPPALGGLVRAVYTDQNGYSNVYNLKTWNSNDTFAINVTASSNSAGDGKIIIQFYINGENYPKINYSPYYQSFSNIINFGDIFPRWRFGFHTISLRDTYKNIVFAGSYVVASASTFNINSNVGIGLSSYPLNRTPIYSTISLLDTLVQNNIMPLQNTTSTLYFDSTAVIGNSTIYNNISTTTINNATFTLQNSGLFTNFIYNTANNSVSGQDTINPVTALETYQNIFFSCKANLNSNNFSNINVGYWGQQFGLMTSVQSNYYTPPIFQFQYSFLLMTDSNGGFPVSPVQAGLYISYPWTIGSFSNFHVKAYNSNDAYSIYLVNTPGSFTSNVVFRVNGEPVFTYETSQYNQYYKVGFSNFFGGNCNLGPPSFTSYQYEDTYTNIAISGSYGIISIILGGKVSAFPSHATYISSSSYVNLGLVDYINEFNILSLSNYTSQLYFGGQGSSIIPIGNFSSMEIIGIGCNAIANAKDPAAVGSVAIGNSAGFTNQGASTVAIGFSAGNYNQGTCAIAIGNTAASTLQGCNTIALGFSAGYSSQNDYAIAIGTQAGFISQNTNAIAIGTQAGASIQGSYTIAIGSNAGFSNQGTSAIAIGTQAGSTLQGQYAIAIGISTGMYSQGNYSIAVGYAAGVNSQYANSIVFNASGTEVNPTTSGFYVKPVRYVNNSYPFILSYNVTTSEILFSDYDINQIITIPNIVSTVKGLGYSGYISSVLIGSVHLISTVQGLGEIGYISTTSLTSTIQGLGFSYISSETLQSTTQGLENLGFIKSTAVIVSTVQGLGTSGYISSIATIVSTVNDLGSLAYISSTATIVSTVKGIGTAGYISSVPILYLISTLTGLGTLGYVSSVSLLQSTVQGLVSLGYISSATLQSTIQGLGTLGYISSTALQSTITGLGTFGYISSASLVSTTQNLDTSGYKSIQTTGFSSLTILGIGCNANANFAGAYSIGIGCNAANTTESPYTISIGENAGGSSNSSNSIFIGNNSGTGSAFGQTIAIGHNAGQSAAGCNTISLGYVAGNILSNYAIAIGNNTGVQLGDSGIAIGPDSGQFTGNGVINIGANSGTGCNANSLDNAIAIGIYAGFDTQQDSAIAIGYSAGAELQGNYAIAIGCNVGVGDSNTIIQAQYDYAIAIGANSATINQDANSIILNACNATALQNTTGQSFFVTPIRKTTALNAISYNTLTSELFYTQSVTVNLINAKISVSSNGVLLTSDSNVKENINSADLPLCYDSIKQLPLRRFTYISSIASSKHDKTQLGFIAQEVYSIFPKSIYSTFSEELSTNILNMNSDQIFISQFGATKLIISTIESTTAHAQQQDSILQSLQDSRLQRQSTILGRNMQFSTLYSLFSQLSSFCKLL